MGYFLQLTYRKTYGNTKFWNFGVNSDTNAEFEGILEILVWESFRGCAKVLVLMTMGDEISSQHVMRTPYAPKDKHSQINISTSDLTAS